MDRQDDQVDGIEVGDDGIGADTVPEIVPPALTVMLPPTRVIVLLVVRLKDNVPLTVVVEALAVEMSTVTVVPAPITTALQEVGTSPGSQVQGDDQLPFVMDVIVPQKVPAFQVMRLAGSLFSLPWPVRVPL